MTLVQILLQNEQCFTHPTRLLRTCSHHPRRSKYVSSSFGFPVTLEFRGPGARGCWADEGLLGADWCTTRWNGWNQRRWDWDEQISCIQVAYVPEPVYHIGQESILRPCSILVPVLFMHILQKEPMKGPHGFPAQILSPKGRKWASPFRRHTHAGIDEHIDHWG